MKIIHITSIYDFNFINDLSIININSNENSNTNNNSCQLNSNFNNSKKNKKEIDILVSDIYKSVSCYSYDLKKEVITEKSRDYSPLWINTCLFYSKNDTTKKLFFLGSDADKNIIIFRQNMNPKSDEEKFRIEK